MQIWNVFNWTVIEQLSVSSNTSTNLFVQLRLQLPRLSILIHALPPSKYLWQCNTRFYFILLITDTVWMVIFFLTWYCWPLRVISSLIHQHYVYFAWWLPTYIGDHQYIRSAFFDFFGGPNHSPTSALIHSIENQQKLLFFLVPPTSSRNI